MEVYVVGCCKAKEVGPSLARDLYKSRAFGRFFATAEDMGEVVILSALYGLVRFPGFCGRCHPVV